jgi:hypothetical protein
MAEAAFSAKRYAENDFASDQHGKTVSRPFLRSQPSHSQATID